MLIRSLGRSILILSADLGMHAAKDAFGYDVESFGSVPLSLAAVWPTTASPLLSLTGSVWRLSFGTGPKPVGTSMITGVSEEGPDAGVGAEPTPPEGGTMMRGSAVKRDRKVEGIEEKGGKFTHKP